MPRLSRLAVFMVGAALGLALWVVPALLSDEPPWNSQGPVFAIALLIMGLILGFLGPGQPAAAIAGVLGGQLIVLSARVMSNPATSDLWLVSAMLLAGYTFVAGGIGAVLGNALRRRLDPARRTRDRRTG
jgi:membrane-bound ClpP family serine protease